MVEAKSSCVNLMLINLSQVTLTV